MAQVEPVEVESHQNDFSDIFEIKIVFCHFDMTENRVKGMTERRMILFLWASVLKRACDRVWIHSSPFNEKI